MLQEFVLAVPAVSYRAGSGGDDALRAAGARLERVFEVRSPAGDYFVTYLEGDREPAGAAELAGQWLDPAITKHRQGLAFVYPLRPGQGAAFREFADQAFRHRRFEHHQSRRALGLTRESIYVQGDLAVFYLEGDHPRGSYEHLAESIAVHDIWFRDQCRTLFREGFDLDSPLPQIRTVSDRELSPVPV